MFDVDFSDLLDYTDWQRERWEALLRPRGTEALAIGIGPNGDGRFRTIGELIRHIFSAERRYVDRLSDRPITDTSTIPADSVDTVFAFGRESRRELRRFLDAFPPDQWDAPREFMLMNTRIRASARKVVLHVVMHEIRHWAQIATLLRLEGVIGEPHDFLMSPILPSSS